MLYYDELSRHKVDIDAALEFMEYVFSVRSNWITRIVKGSVEFNKVDLPHGDIDLMCIDAYVQKLFKQAKKDRKQLEFVFENK